MMPAIFRTLELSPRRLDPWHYQPQFQTLRAAIRATGKAAELNVFVEPVRGVTGGATPLGAEYQSQGVVRFYRTTEIRNMRVCHDEAVFITAADDEDLARSRLLVGDVLLTITGANFGESAVVEDYHLPGNISQHSVRFGVLGLNPYFLVAYLNSRPGQSIIWQQAYGATRPAIDYPSVRELLVLNPSEEVQSYIGDKVRQTELLRKRAGTLEADFAEIMRLQCPEVFGGQKEFGRCSRVSAASLRRDLNPGAFNPERLRIRAEIKKAGGRQLIEVASIEASVTDSFAPDDDYIGLDSISSATSQLAPVKVAQAEVEGAARVLCEGPVISKLRPYLNKVSYIPAELARAFGSTELLCVRPKAGVSGWFIYGALKLQCTVRQFQPLANGSTLPRIDAEDVLEVMVPWHDDAALLGQDLERAQAMYFTAEKLTSAAKHLVEALIEGKVSEADLVNAQEALERGDISADRALLRRLTRKGFDVADEPPLFPNLDALYELLAQTEPATE
jgi:type I restriction enzyme S subunit